MTERNPAGEDKQKLTAVGCVLTLLTVGVIFGSAIPIVMWRHPETGESLPRRVAILVPFVVGGAFYGLCLLLLRLVGLRVWAESEKDESTSSEQ